MTPTRRVRDTQRTRLYAAENILAHLSRTYETVPEVQDYINSITRSPWYAKQTGGRRLRVDVTDGRRRRSGGAFPWFNQIRLPRFTRKTYYILHELAHLMAWDEAKRLGEPYHGRTFVRTYIALVERFMGKEAASLFRSRLREHNVKWARRRPGFRPAHDLRSKA